MGSDFLRALDIMRDAVEANHEAHTLKEGGEDPAHSFEIKNKHLVWLYLEFGGSGLLDVTVQDNQISFILLGSGLGCHSKKRELRNLIRSNGYPPEIRAALYKRFGMRPPAEPKTQTEQGRNTPRRNSPHNPSLS